MRVAVPNLNPILCLCSHPPPFTLPGRTNHKPNNCSVSTPTKGAKGVEAGMSKKRKSTAATANALPDTLRVAYTPPVRRLLSRLSKDSLAELSLGWLGSTEVNLTRVEDEEEGEEGEEMEIEAVKGIYEGFGRIKSVRAKEVVERITEHEWRDGLTLGMVAELDFRCLLPFPPSSSKHNRQRGNRSSGPPKQPKVDIRAALPPIQTSPRRHRSQNNLPPKNLRPHTLNPPPSACLPALLYNPPSQLTLAYAPRATPPTNPFPLHHSTNSPAKQAHILARLSRIHRRLPLPHPPFFLPHRHHHLTSRNSP